MRSLSDGFFHEFVFDDQGSMIGELVFDFVDGEFILVDEFIYG